MYIYILLMKSRPALNRSNFLVKSPESTAPDPTSAAFRCCSSSGRCRCSFRCRDWDGIIWNAWSSG